jgi:hypothetical protein
VLAAGRQHLAVLSRGEASRRAHRCGVPASRSCRRPRAPQADRPRTTKAFFPGTALRGEKASDSDFERQDSLREESKVPPFNILDSETRRSDVSLHVPPKANPNVDEEFTASPSQRRSSRRKRSSLSMDASESPSSKPIAKRSKVIDKASTGKSSTAPIITTDTCG